MHLYLSQRTCEKRKRGKAKERKEERKKGRMKILVYLNWLDLTEKENLLQALIQRAADFHFQYIFTAHNSYLFEGAQHNARMCKNSLTAMVLGWIKQSYIHEAEVSIL